ncbi:MAG: asparagine synthase-related protein [Alphaproteobacteria bacterium]
MLFLNDIHHNWTEEKIAENTITLLYKGSEKFAHNIINVVSHCVDLETEIKNHLQSNHDFTSGYIETSTHAVAWVDHIRSWPIFYNMCTGTLSASNNARNLKNQKIDENSCLEFAMSGYVTGKNTLYENIKCLQPGEFLIWEKNNLKLTLVRYYQYSPNMNDTTQTWDRNKQKLDQILNNLTKKVIQNANGRPIWIPLSGGLDSRILLCKLHEHQYPNLHTFTYGPRYNFESKIAKKVAKKLNVPWYFICPPKKQIKEYFNNEDRKKFWYTTDGYKSIASMREFSALMYLRDKKIIHRNAIILNGQSGDYITGNHISKLWRQDREFSPDDLFQILFDKHYELWSTLKKQENLEIIKERIIALLPDNWTQAKTGIDFASLEEIWEFDARQICLVANGQKSYDYFGYDWEMPLWEKELVDFCEKLPFDQKIDQSLYKEYLKDYNYFGLFSEKESHIWRWPMPMLWVIPIAQIIGLFFGKQKKNNFYALMRYHGHYSNQFYNFSWKTHKKTYAIARNVMSLNVREFIIENPKVFPSKIKNMLVIQNVD